MEVILRESREGVLKEIADVCCVLSNKSDAPGLQAASQNGVPVASFANEGELVEKLQEFEPDYLILAGFMRILSPRVIEKYPKRIINIHPADTSLFRGLHAYEWAFENRREETTITVHYVDEGVDTGEVIAKAPVDLRGTKTLKEVESRGLAVEHQLYSQVLAKTFKEELLCVES